MRASESDGETSGAHWRRPSVRVIVITAMLSSLVVTALVGLVLYSSWNHRRATNNDVDDEVAKIDALHDFQKGISEQGTWLTTYAAIHDDIYAANFHGAHARTGDVLTALQNASAGDSREEVSELDVLAAEYETFSNREVAVVSALQRNDLAGALALGTGVDGLQVTGPALETRLDGVIADARDQLSVHQAADAGAQRTALWSLLGIVGMSSVLLLALGLAALRWLVKPLERASRATRAMAAGDLDARVDAGGPRELARLGSDVNDMAMALIRRSNELNSYLSDDLVGRTAELETRTVELESSEQRFRALVQHGTDLITVIEADGTITYQSPAVQEMLGRAAADVVGMRLTELAHPDDVHDVAAFITDAMKIDSGAASAAVRLGAADGTWVHVEIVGTDHRDDPAIRGLVLNIRDVNERHALEEQLRFGALHDPLTGLANRAQFADRLMHASERSVRRMTQLAVLFLDLDNFKSVNDGLGHSAGDALLIEVGQRLRACMRAEDTVARFGGDEFAMLIEEVTGPDEAIDAAHRIRTALHAPFRLEERDIVVLASIGIAVGAGEGDADVLLRNADVAMYAAKALGKNRQELYEPSMHEAALDRLDLAGDLDGAVERGEFVLEYQPVVTLATGEVASMEALVRWNHPTRGRIPPDGFIPLAEETGAIIPLGRWVVLEACRQARAWCDEFGDDPMLGMAVNVSARQLLDPGFSGVVAQALAESEIEPGALVLEITESVMMRDAGASLAALRELKSLGVRLAIDDFGTGYSSLSYLRQFPFDILKIDRSFLTAGGQPALDHDLERAIVDLGRTLKLEIVAEGVERLEQLARLKSLDCDLGQGFYFARPMPAAAMAELLRERRVVVEDAA